MSSIGRPKNTTRCVRNKKHSPNIGTHKVCPDCKKKFKINLHWKGYQNYCYKCKSKRNRPNQLAKYKEIRWRLYVYLLEHPCIDCGEEDPILLEFDHIHGKKKDRVSRMLSGRYSWNSILKEIKKCAVRCVACHRRKTTRDRMHWKLTAVRLGIPAWLDVGCGKDGPKRLGKVCGSG